ncbi:MAG: type II secretion system F family protein [Candidatus Binatia bacterium]
MELLLVAIGTFGFVGGLSLLFLAPKIESEEEIIQRRLASISSSSLGRNGQIGLFDDGEKTFWEQTANFFLGEKELPERYNAVSRTLHQAGFSGERAVRIFWGVCIFSTLAFAAAAFLLASFSFAPLSSTVLLVVAAAGVGYLLPHSNIRRKARLRMREIRETFPDTLDLLVVCVEGGLGIDNALVRVAEEQQGQGLAIGDEFLLMSREMQAGLSRREALTRLADRLDLEEVRGLTAFLVQTEEIGGSIARSLRVYAETMRQKRIQRAEETARKLVIKLLLPLAFCIMPAMFCVIFSPPAINIAKLIGSLPGAGR